jgi:hypothetical protein
LVSTKLGFEKLGVAEDVEEILLFVEQEVLCQVVCRAETGAKAPL